MQSFKGSQRTISINGEKILGTWNCHRGIEDVIEIKVKVNYGSSNNNWKVLEKNGSHSWIEKKFVKVKAKDSLREGRISRRNWCNQIAIRGWTDIVYSTK